MYTSFWPEGSHELKSLLLEVADARKQAEQQASLENINSLNRRKKPPSFDKKKKQHLPREIQDSDGERKHPISKKDQIFNQNYGVSHSQLTEKIHKTV